MILKILLTLTKIYRRITPTHRGRYAGFRLAQWLSRHGVIEVPAAAGPGIRLAYAPDIGLDIVLTEVMLDGVYEPEETDILRGLTPRGGTVIDVGANLGYFTLVASQWVGPHGRVVAFEPVARMFGHLKRNIALNAATNVWPVQAACAASPGSMRMALTADSGSSHLVHSAAAAGPTELVTVTTLAEYHRRHPLTRLDLIKIDVEGADFEVVKGGRELIEQFRPAIFMECHFLHRFDASIDDVRRFLEPLGYTVTEKRNTHSVDLLCVQATRQRTFAQPDLAVS